MNEVLGRKEMTGGRRVINKHVAAIHSSNKLSLLERRASNVLLFHALPALRGSLSHKIRFAELKRLLGFNSRNHLQLKRAIIRLTEVTVRWNLCGDKIDGVGDEWFSASFLASVHHKGGDVFYEYSGLVQSLLVTPGAYGKISLSVQSRFRSGYALALYENCSRYRGLGHTRAFSVGLFRELMGVERGTYSRFSELDRRVLRPAVDEINSKADINVRPAVVRVGRRVVAIKFSVSESPSIGAHGGQSDSEKRWLVSSLGLSEEEIFMVTNKYGRERVELAARQLKRAHQYKAGGVSNIGAYLRAIIENDYKDAPLRLKKRAEEARRDLDEDARGSYERYESGAVFEICRNLPCETKRELAEELLRSGKSFHRRNTAAILARGGGLDNPILYDRDGGGIVAFLRAAHPGLLRSVLDQRTFLEKGCSSTG